MPNVGNNISSEDPWLKEVRYIERQLRRNLIMETTLIAFALGCSATLALGAVAHSYLWTGSAAEYAGGVYVLVVHIVFHMSEFLTASVQRPHDTHPDAFMIIHSWPYVAAMAMSLIEFFVELYVVPESWKLSPAAHPWLATVLRLNYTSATVFGATTAVFYLLRTIAMIQCGSNFSLMVETRRRGSHVLVDTGLYRYLRHPAYCGWFWRTVFAQLIVANPVSAILHTAVTWYFFSMRIPSEEYFLEQPGFFGEMYTAYKRRTYIGIPFIPAHPRWGLAPPRPPQPPHNEAASVSSDAQQALLTS